jgi:dienelactone hydrolase
VAVTIIRLFITLILIFSASSSLAFQGRSLPPDVIRARVVEANANRSLASVQRFTEESFQFTIPSNGKVLTAKLLVPVHETKHPRYPVLSVFGGFQSGAKVLEILKPKVPVIVATFEYPFDAPRRFEFPKSLSYAPNAKQAITDMLDGMYEMHNALKQRDDVDPVKITVVGASFGAPFALAAAAKDTTISGVVVVHGFGDIPGTVKHQLSRSWQPKLGALAGPAAWLFSHLAWFYLDGPAPEDSALRLTSRQRVLMIQAEQDSYIPTSSSIRLWQAIDQSSAQRERIMTPGDHIQPTSERMIENISDQVVEWMKRVELL